MGGRGSVSRIDDPKAYQAEGVLFLTPNARFDFLLQRPEGSTVGKAVNEAMSDVEKHNAQLAGVPPRNYQIFNGTLLKELLKKVSELSIFGVEKTDETGRLCRMNLAVHGLEGDIRHGGEVNSNEARESIR
ncbi:MAG: N-6 DNA methylase [Burkholderiales bacterium]